MALTPGTRLGPYAVTAQIGVGGMGEVYRATDTKLDRQVAIKVLPDAVAQDAERLARFDREAKTLAALNHPGIAQIYGLEDSDGTKALVMELVEGPTLADRIAQGPIPVDEALPIAKQIAEALEAAHEQGIIHRDLKPANIKLRPDGTVKVLDFGLAKAMEPPAAASPSASMSPTITTPAMTQAGLILGTAAYMSPEQARGKPVDRRADIWAFGCVLYEMLTGQRAFPGEDVTETLAAVVKSEVDWVLVPELSPPLEMFLRQCLRKNPRQRLGDIRELRLALEGAFDTTALIEASASMPLSSQARVRGVGLIAGVAIVSAIVTGVAMVGLSPGPATRVTRLLLSQSVGEFEFGNNTTSLALSPDGGRVAYKLVDEGEALLVVQNLDALEPVSLFRGEADTPVFSQDGEWVAFLDGGDDWIKRVARTGGPVIPVSPLGATGIRGASWGPEGIAFGTIEPSGLWQVSPDGGAPEPLTMLEESRGEVNHWWPYLLPERDAVLFTVFYEGQDADAAQVAVRDLRSGEQRILVSGGTTPKYAPTGHLLYVSAGRVHAVPFDVDSLTIRGEPVEVAAGVRGLQTGGADVELASDGSLLYVAGVSPSVDKQLVWVDAQGEEAVRIPPGNYFGVRLSPDGTRALVAERSGAWDVWLWDFRNESRTRLPLTTSGARQPIWVGETRVAWHDRRGAIYWQEVGNAGTTELLLEDTGAAGGTGPHFALPGGAGLVFGGTADSDNDDDIGLLPLNGDGDVTWLVREPFNERNSELSPDGRYIAYTSNEGGINQVYVRPFGSTELSVQVSRVGGEKPKWSPDGSALYYIEPSARPQLVRVATELSGDGVALGARTELLDWPYFVNDAAESAYEVSPDGGRFLAIRDSGGQMSAQVPDGQIVVVQNFFAELERLVPTGN